MPTFTHTFQEKQAQSQRGFASILDGTVTLTSTTAYRQRLFDICENGAKEIVVFVKPSSANCAVKYQVSMDGTNWIDVATVAQDASAQASSGITVSAAAIGYLILNYTNDAPHMGFRYHAVLLTNADTTSNAVEIHAVAT